MNEKKLDIDKKEENKYCCWHELGWESTSVN